MNLEEAFNGLFEKLQTWISALVTGLPNLVLAILILLVSFFVARFIRNVVLRVMNQVSSYAAVNKLLSRVAYVGIVVVGIVTALGVLHLSTVVATILGGAGVIGLAIGFASQDIAANFISGILLSVRRPFREGDIVETNDSFGTVEEINIRATEVRTFAGQIVVIPNKDVFQSPIVNYSRLGTRRIDLSCGVAYGDDLGKARDVALSAIGALDFIDAERKPDLYYNEFGDSSINFVVRYWIDFAKQTDFLRAQSEGIVALKSAFDANGITIPFPIRTLDFGVVGGQRLDQVLPRHLYGAEHTGTNQGSTTTG